ncbi:MAG: SocA family protein [Xanthomonadales bacterium]|nr:SocA family protein [Xanthomonadales bacterium]
MPFNEAKAVQAIAWLLNKAGGRLDKWQLIKMLYLAERTYLRKHGALITGDRFVSMQYGPVVSSTYDLIKASGARVSEWSRWLNPVSEHAISLRADLSVDREAMQKLCDAEIAELDAIFEEFGHMSGKELVDFTHDNCHEWLDPKGSSVPITTTEVLEAQGVTRSVARAIAESVREDNALQRFMAAL